MHLQEIYTLVELLLIIFYLKMLHSLFFESYFWLIYIAVFIISILSAAIGASGGTILLAIMSQFLALESLIPLHGIIQLSSNLTRGWFLKNSIDWKISRDAIIGAMIGGIAGHFYIVPIPENWTNLLMGIFILIITFTPQFQANFNFPGKWIIIGFLASSLGLFVGAIGPFVGSLLLSENLDKKVMVGTQAILQMAIHLMKIIVFLSLGFTIWPWMLLIIGTLICTYTGTFYGIKILDFIPTKFFRYIMIAFILILALRMVYIGLISIVFNA